MTRFAIAVGACALMLSILVPAVGAAETSADDGIARVATSEYGSYVVIMRDNPLLAQFDQVELNTSTAGAERDRLRAAQARALSDAGISIDKKVNEFTNAANGFSALIGHEEAEALLASPDVLLVMPDTFRTVDTDNTPSFLGLNERGAAWASGFTGENVIVGVIDSGIWPEHPSFADDGSYSDLGITLDESMHSACDFGNSAHNPDDADFECNNKLLGARQIVPTYRAVLGAEDFEYDSARDDAGHGTNTASTAAGNADVDAEIFGIDRGTVSGIAPRARIIAYKGLGTLGGFSSDLAASIDQAVADGVDVINYSVGGSPSLLGADDIAYLFAADAGVFVATSAGNNGPGPGTINGPASVPWLTSVAASTQDRTWQGSASSSGGWEFTGASITASTDEVKLVDAADAGDALCAPGALDPSVVESNVVLCLRGGVPRVEKSRAVDMAGGAGMILYNPIDEQELFTDNHHVPSVHIDFTDGSAIKAYIAFAGDAAVAQVNGGEFTPQEAPHMAYFSSRGPDPVAEDIIKPDVTAPGVQILAGETPTPGGVGAGAPRQLFQAASGTSMSSPHVAGVFALIKEARPDWSPAAAKSAIMTTAYQQVRKQDGLTRADPFDMGAGHLDPSGRARKIGSVFNPGIYYDAGFNDYLAFLCDAAPEWFADPDASCALLESLGYPTDPSELNLASIGIAELVGSQTVTRTVTSTANRTRTWRARVAEPPGFDVTVSPAEIILGPHESATFQVTITATDGVPTGEWRFGELRWRTRGTVARSPIAVRAQL